MNIKLKQAREASGKTQAEVAQAVGIDPRLYQRYEYDTSTPNVRTAILIARVLDSTVEQLFGAAISIHAPI